MMQRIAMTGSSGYYGRTLIQAIRTQCPEAEILGFDLQQPNEHPADQLIQIDIRDPQLAEHLKNFNPDTVIHLAFVLKPMKDLNAMHSINIDGSQNVFAAVEKIQPERLLVASSATAYGAWPDNPIPMSEDWPLRISEGYQYAADKTRLDQLIAEFAENNQDINVSWTRAGIILGPDVDNFIADTLLHSKYVLLVDGNDTPRQYVHQVDVANASLKILLNKGRGAYNVAPNSWITQTELATLLNKKTKKAPYWLFFLATWLGWKLKLSRFTPGSIDFYRYPWVITPTRLTKELGYTFQFEQQQAIIESINK